MNALRREYSRRILAHLLTDGPLSTTELSDRVDKAQSTVSWHLSKLAEANLVTKERDGRSVVYEINDPDRIKYLYTVHQRSFTDKVVDRMLGLWDGY
nr:metalloregulator ArsR/SmtB family transcription factor [Halogeometricum sp. CBA1124]